MFEGLQRKWKVNGLHLILIICTFAIAGSLTGYVARKLMNLLQIGEGWVWVVLFIFLVTILWPLAVILVSIPMGQYSFFKKYLQKIGRRIGIGKAARPGGQTSSQGEKLSPGIKRIAIFASGAGSNAQKIIDRLRKNNNINVSLIVTNKPGAGVVQIAEREKISMLIIEKERFFRGDAYLAELKEKKVDWIILAGFLWKIPSSLIKAFSGRIINIHPALLPKYGGQGMYGHRVHEAVISNKDLESGISIHYVDDLYDHGSIIFQARCHIADGETADSLAAKIHYLEHEHYPRVVEELVSN